MGAVEAVEVEAGAAPPLVLLGAVRAAVAAVREVVEVVEAVEVVVGWAVEGTH